MSGYRPAYQIAKGKVHYNYEMSEGAGGGMPGISVFYKDAAGDIFTPIPPTRAGATS